MPFYAAQINSLKVVTLTYEANTAVYTCIPVAFFAVACGADVGGSCAEVLEALQKIRKGRMIHAFKQMVYFRFLIN